MFQNITAHFRVETGLIFEVAAISGEGKQVASENDCPSGLYNSSQVPKQVLKCWNQWNGHKHKYYLMSYFNRQELCLSFKTQNQALIFLFIVHWAVGLL